MAFTVKGQSVITSQEVEVSWDAGELSGTFSHMVFVRMLARRYARERRPIGPIPGGGRRRMYLGDPLSALHLIMEVFRHPTVEVTGDVPEAAIPPALANADF